MEKALIRQNTQWSGKAFEGLCQRDIMNNLLNKKLLLTYNQKKTYGDVEAVPFWEWAMSD